MEWNEDKAENIVKRYKRRFSLRLSIKVMQVLLTLFLIYIIYLFIVQFIYVASGGGERLELYQKLALDWTHPTLTSDLSLRHEANNEITPYLTQKIDIPLERRIGMETYEAAELQLKKSLLWPGVKKEIESTGLNGSFYEFEFYLPRHPVTDKKLGNYDNPAVWDTLEMIHEGHVANLAFSTEEFYSPEEIAKLLEPYDLAILWMPLYMGEYKELKERNFVEKKTMFDDDELISIHPQWGLSGARGLEKHGGFYFTELDSSEVEDGRTVIEESQAMMLKNMEKMLTENKRLAEQVLETNQLQERYDYLNEHGFKAYGAVVTGPVKELLKLQKEDGIHGVILGDIKLWNWSE